MPSVKRLCITATGATYDETKRHRLRRHREEYNRQEVEKRRLFGSGEEKRDWAEKVWDQPAPDTDKLASHYKKERAAKKFSASARALEGRAKRHDRIDAPYERMPLVLDFGAEALAGKAVVSGKKLVCGYPEGFHTTPLTFAFKAGEKVALLGDNGAGKSTLLATLTGTLAPLAGELFINEKVRFGF
ncbi:MAG: ATP-binding cassette domain-containing protein [Candidatus Moraniibacteriota bacterium]